MATVTNLDIFEAIKQHNIVIVEQLLKNGINPNIQNEEMTPLHFGASYDAFEIVELLLKHGADPNTPNNHGSTPLYFASRGYFKIVKLLLEHGADPNFQNNRCNTPLMIASFFGKHDIIMILIDYGADCNVIDANGKSVFDYEGGNFIREYLESKEHQIVLK